MSRNLSRRALAFAAGGALFLCAASSMAQQPKQTASTAPANQIVIDNFTFTPANLTVSAGTKVVWVNKDEEPHTVYSVDQQAGFKSPALDTDDQFGYVFSKPGTYKYFCSIHSHMVGTVTVK
ncbi:MAG TPA: cupredoxin family copper-binding protein [Stellaceae bacterium]|jgi:plastocyanin|nr:cupredoxin family copper-binding protein [Stellaceae bacterium]